MRPLYQMILPTGSRVHRMQSNCYTQIYYFLADVFISRKEFCMGKSTKTVVPQIKRNSILHIIRDCFCDVSMNNSRLFDADSALYFI